MDSWNDYELIDSGFGMKLERWGAYTLARPEPQAIWPASLPPADWNKADGTFTRTEGGKGNWKFSKEIPERWHIAYKQLSFWVKPTSFKHTGLFPEQAHNWDWIMQKISQRKAEGKPVRMLNLFGYTGGATVAGAFAGAEVTHVDASKGMVDWTKENLELSGLGTAPVRLIVDDALKFVQREKKRGATYDAIIMDPPSYGRGAKGELWKLEEKLWPLIETCAGILSDTPLFILVNSYSAGFSPTVIENILRSVPTTRNGTTTALELLLNAKHSLSLPQGYTTRWENV